MNAPRPADGFTLAELLIALVIASIILLPLADMLHVGTDTARAVRSSLDASADARFALDRIATQAGIVTGATPPQPASASAAAIAQAWLAPLQYTLKGSDLVETDPGAKSTRIIAANVASFKVEAPAPEPGWRPVLFITLALDPVATGCGERCAYARAVRLGPTP
jgi:prepilin-type N-terminal cleavage/methylation domain-containing protein